MTAISSAQRHKFLHYEAIALELYGFYCMDNKKEKKGVENIQLAIDKYTEWGALSKVGSLQQQFLGNLEPSQLEKKLEVAV